ncbi:hypothetical protein NC653_013194 [Populus alba x Populus x berolinensis]|uniref:RNA cytosine-C(5)-methyltransferase NSUN2-like PUA domain-containing protein n=1 Tax=Populus alba x Populus x berolinensis TaxID=444605 RepID=A0AAD6QTR5_9ROSI|nr:hypothetical protein NC653_013194 [Populus alba x Populus x berolinensis]
MGGRGRGNRSRTQRKHFRDGRENVWKRHKSDSASSDPNSNRNSDNKTHWQPFSTQNPGFDEYYKEQGIVTPEEWDTFVEVLRTPLPVALGVFVIVVTSCYSSKKMWMKNLDADFSNTTDGDEVEAIRPLPWYPDNLAWHSNFSRMQLRKNQTLERNPGKGNGLHSLQIQIALRGTLMKYLHSLRFQGNTKVRFEEFGWKFMVAAELGFLAFGDNQGFQGFDFEKSCHGACSERQTSREDSKAMSDPTKADASTIAIGCWKGRSNLSVMVTAIDCQV